MRAAIIVLLCLFSTSGWSENNKLIVCENGLEMFNWDLEFIRHAEHSIEALVCFFGGETAQTLLAEIETRIKEVPQLQVHMLASPVFLQASDLELLNRLQSQYPHNFHLEYHTQIVKLFPDLTTIDNHVKLVIIDEECFSVGGTNFEEHHCGVGTFTLPGKKETCAVDQLLPTSMRDQDVVGKGPLAVQLRKIFFHLYAIWEEYNQTCIFQEDPDQFQGRTRYNPLSEKNICLPQFDHSKRLRTLGHHQINYFLGGPHQNQNAIAEEYIRLIREAKEEIILAHLYFFPTDPIFEALIDAVNRGVKLTLITNGLDDQSCGGAGLFIWANRMCYVPMFYGKTYHLCQASDAYLAPLKNTSIYEYCVPNVILHKKMMLVDNRFFVVGSFNLGMKSAYGDYELILSIDSEKVARDVLKVLQADLMHSRQVCPKEALDWYFDPWFSFCGELQKRYSGFL